MRFRSASMSVVLMLCACFGKSNIDIVTPHVRPTEPIPASPEVCELPAAKPVTSMLRLSNYEYQQIASDLLKQPIETALLSRWIPVPAVFGFDTMSEARIDAQGLGEQLRTAETLTTRLMQSPDVMGLCPAVTPRPAAVCTEKAGYEPIADFSTTQGAGCWQYLDSTGAAMGYVAANSRWEGNGALVWNTGMHPGNADAVRRWTVPQDGSLTLTGEFRDVDPGGGDGIVAVIRKNGAEVWRATIANSSSDSFELAYTVKRGDTFDFVVNKNGDTAYDTTAFNANIAWAASINTAGWTWANCGKPVVEHVATRMLRRPLTADEQTDYQALFDTAMTDATAADLPSPFWSSLETVLPAALVAPSVVYKGELTGALDPSQRAFEVASRLSLFFCSSFPDEELWNTALNGSLNDRKVAEAQANRLLDKCLGRFANNFAGQWLAYRPRLDVSDTEPLTPSMRKESADVFAALITSGAKTTDLLAPGYTFVDKELSQHYGIDFGAEDGDKIHRVATQARGGLFAQGYFLTSTAKGSDFKRVIDRGIYTLNRVLCRQLPPLNAATREEIAASMMAIDPSLSLAQRMKMHREKGTSCQTCHSQMDPIGLALEKYDSHGQWRDAYADGTLITNDFQLDGHDVRDPSELAKVVEATQDFRECVVTQLITYGLNRPMNLDEQHCMAKQMAYPLDLKVPTLRELVVSSALTAVTLTGGLQP